MSLSDEIRENSKKVHTTEMRISIGEIISMYKENEIIIQPEFQRLFRWNIEQKSKFIESILTGIPIPSVFVQQLENGSWELIDGLQRVSTILEFVGILVDKETKILYEHSELVKTKFLPSLDGMSYESFEDNPNQKDSKVYFNREDKLIFKRTPILFQVVKRDSDSSTKYELFDRLNSGASPLTDQEIRSAIFLNEKPEAIKLIKELKDNSDFIETTRLSDRNINEAYNEELVLRFFAYLNLAKNPKKIDFIKEFLDTYLKDEFDNQDIENMRNSFIKFFSFLNANTNSPFQGKSGGFTISKFEILTIGLSSYLDDLETHKKEYIKKINYVDKELWFTKATAKRSVARNRLEIYTQNAAEYFKI